MSEWIEWRGGKCPIDYQCKIDLKFRCGEVRSHKSPDAACWLHDSRKSHKDEYDVVAYRFSEQQSMEEAYEQTHKEIGDSALDQQHGGDHYKKMGDYQPWEVLRHWLTPEEFRGYMKGEAITYLARERSKGGTLDINKAAHTLKALLELEDK